MSDRTKGLLNISANFEVQSAEGLDSRCRVKTKASLILLDTWKSSDNNPYTYVGMLVSVYEDSELNNGVYRLKTVDYTIMDNWKKVSGDPFGNSGELQLNSGGTFYSTSSLTYDFDNNILKVNTISASTYYGDGSNLTGLVATLSGLTDVSLNNLVTGEVLIYSANTWKNNSLDFNYISSKPTTLSGYGITDAYTKTEQDNRYVNVTGDTMTGNLTLPSLTATTSIVQVGNSGNTVTIYEKNISTSEIFASSDLRIRAGTTANIALVTNNITRMFVDYTGYIGIGNGSTTPTKLLDINGDILVNGITIGRGSGNTLTNTSVGVESLGFSLSSSTNNTSVGYRSLFFLSNGTFNTSFGAQSLNSLISGSQNTSFGAQSAFYNQASNNTNIGYQSMYYPTNANNNTSIGMFALRGTNTSTTMNSNIAIGYSAGKNATSNYELYISSNQYVDNNEEKSNSIIYGVMTSSASTQKLYLNSSVGIMLNGSATTAKLHVHEPSGANNYIKITNNDTTTSINRGLDIGLTTTEKAILWNYEPTSLSLATNNVERMTITSGGSVGINIINPDVSYKLQVSGDTKIFGSLTGTGSATFNTLKIDNNTSGLPVVQIGNVNPFYMSMNWPTLSYNAYWNSGWKYGAGSSNQYGAFHSISPSTGSFDFYISTVAGNTDATMPIINTLSLRPNGDAYVNNILHATTLQGNLDWTYLTNTSHTHLKSMITDFVEGDYVHTTGTETINGTKTFNDNVTVRGNVYIAGTATTIYAENLGVKDNLITINSGETNSGVTRGYAGIEIDRGQLTNYIFIFDENQQNFRIGQTESQTANTQAVATREDSPISSGISFWNDSQYRFDTSNNLTWNGSNLNINGSISATTIYANIVGNVDWSSIQNRPTSISGYGITDAYTTAQTNSNFLSANTFSSVINTNGINNNGSLTSTTSYIGDLYLTNTPISNTALTNLLVRDTDGSIKVRTVSSVLPNTVYEGIFYVSKPIYATASTYAAYSGCSATIIGTGVTDITSTDSTYNSQLSIATMGNSNKPYPCPYSARNAAMTAIQTGVIKNALIIVLNGSYVIGSNQIAQNGTEDGGTSTNQTPDLQFWQSRSTSIASLYQDKIDYYFNKNTRFTYICKSFPIYFGYNVDSNDTIFNSNIYGDGRFLQVYGEGSHNSKFMYIDNANANVEFNANYTSFSQYNTFQFINYENINVNIKTLKASDTRLFEFGSTREGSGTPSKLNVNIEYAQWGKGLSDYPDNSDWWETITLLGSGTNRTKFIDFYIKKLRMNQGPYGIWRNVGQSEFNVNVKFNIDELYQTDDQIFTGSLANRLGLIAPSWGGYSGIVSASTYIFNIGNAVTDLALLSTNSHFDRFSTTDVYFELNVGSHTKNQNSNSGRLKGNIIVGGNLDNSLYGSGKSQFRINGRYRNTQAEVITHDNTYASSVNQRHYFNGIFETTTGVEPINMTLSNDHNMYFQNTTLVNSATTSFKSNAYNSLSIGGNLSVVIGGSGITSYSANTVYVPYLNLSYTPTTGSTSNNILVRNGGGQIEVRDASTILTTWSAIYNTPTTISGYSITDAYTISQVDGLISGVTNQLTAHTSLTGSSNPHQTSFNDLVSTSHTHLWTDIDNRFVYTNLSSNTILDSFSTSLTDGCHWNYVIKNNNSLEAGTIIGVWDYVTSASTYTQYSTDSLGNTNNVTFNIQINNDNVELVTIISSGNWNIKLRRLSI